MENIQTNQRGNYQSSGNDTGVLLFKKISWAAIIAGVIIAIVIQLLLSLLGLGIGLGSINPTQESQPFQGLGTGSIIWWIISMLIALFVGGWVTGRQSNLPEKTDRILNAVLMWSLFTLLTIYFFSSLTGSIVRGATNLAGKATSVAVNAVQSAAPEVGNMIQENTNIGNGSGNIISEVKEVLRQTGKEELQPENLENRAENAGAAAMQNPQQIDELVNRLFGPGSNTVDAADKEALVNVVVARTGKSQAEAEAQVNNWIATYQNAKAEFAQAKGEAIQQVKETGEDVASAASKVAIYSFIGLLLGALAAAFGSGMAKPVYDMIQVNNTQAT